MLQSTSDSKQSFSIYFKRAISPNPVEFRKPPDTSHPWGFTLTVYTSKVQGMIDLVVLNIDEKPGKSYTLVQPSPNNTEIIEVDEQFKFILEKVKLYTISQVITVKGTEYSWNQSDYTIRFFNHSSTTNPRKYSFLELSSPFIFQEKKRLEETQKQIFKFATETIVNTESSIATLSQNVVNINELARYKNYIKHFYPLYCKSFFV